MARIGPNQDINDPETIINLAYVYQQMSNDKGDFLAQSNAQDPNAEGPPIVDVSIPFSIFDGSTELLFGSDISFDEGYIYDTDLVSRSVILTYVNLAERFREYWSTLNNVLGQLSNFEYSQDEEIPPAGPFTTIFPGNVIFTHGSLGGTSHEQTSYSHLPTESRPIPEWDGVGPTDYNQLTYPQLLSELSGIAILRNEVQISWDTDYSYSHITDSIGSVQVISARLGKDENFISNIEQQYVQFHNVGLTTINVELSISVIGSFDGVANIGVASWAEIGDLNDYPDPFGGIKSLLPSYVASGEDFPGGGGVKSINVVRTTEIPPGKSAFIGGLASGGSNFGAVGTVNIVLILDGQTLTHSGSTT